MNPVEGAIAAVSACFAIAMGGSGLAPAFAVALGSRIASRWSATLTYAICVFAGAVFFGSRVAKTLAGGIVAESTLTPARVLIVLGAACAALLVANLLRVPQSTSWVTVFSLVSLGTITEGVRFEPIVTRLLPAWCALPVLAFVFTYVGMRILYPLRKTNLRLHQWLAGRSQAARFLVLGTSAYVSVAIGSNNVANVVGPVSAAGVVDSVLVGFVLVAPLFGLGALVFSEPARTVGEQIVPIGAVAASLVSLVVGTLLLVASSLGIPQSLVHLNAGAVFAVWRVKDDTRPASDHLIVRRMLVLWITTPIIAATLTALATAIAE